MLTVPEAAARTGRSPETIRRWIRAGKLASKKVGTQHLVDERALDDVTGTRRRSRTAETAPGYVPTAAIPSQSKLLERITIIPDVLGGAPAVKGTRISVEHVLQNLAAGWTLGELLRRYPTITNEDIRACFAYAAELLGEEAAGRNAIARRTAGRAILDATPMPVPDLESLRAELDALRAGGA